MMPLLDFFQYKETLPNVVKQHMLQSIYLCEYLASLKKWKRMPLIHKTNQDYKANVTRDLLSVEGKQKLNKEISTVENSIIFHNQQCARYMFSILGSWKERFPAALLKSEIIR